MYGTGVISFWERTFKDCHITREQLEGMCREMQRYYTALGVKAVSLSKEI